MKNRLGIDYYDVIEVSELIGLSGTTIREYFISGKIIGKKIGKGWYAKVQDVKAYLNNNDSKPAKD